MSALAAALIIHELLKLWPATNANGYCTGFAIALAYSTYIWQLVKDWYNNLRLMCIKKDKCAVGTVTHPPEFFRDGDRKINLHLAPFSPAGAETKMIELLNDMRGELPNVPPLIELQERKKLVEYLNNLDGVQSDKFYIRLIDERLMNDPEVAFQRHFYRRDKDIMGDRAYNHTKSDLLTDEKPNIQFRVDGSGNVKVPYFHTEVEGDTFQRFWDNLWASVVAGLAVALGLCITCVAIGGTSFICETAGQFLAPLLSFLLFILLSLFNNPGQGRADMIDVDVEGSDVEDRLGQGTNKFGDLVLTFGDWIMDTQHDYFEIHPVKSYYLLCREGNLPNIWNLTEEVDHVNCDLHPSNIKSSDLDRMCKIVSAAETQDPEETLHVPVEAAMAMMP